MKPHLQEYIDEFNEGEFDNLLAIFGSMGRILKFFHKEGVIDKIDPFDGHLEDYQLEILNLMLNELNDKGTMDYCISQLSDVFKESDGYYLRLKDRSELSVLFSDNSRNLSARDAAKAVLSDDMWETYSDTTDNVIRDVIEELSPENMEYFKQYLLGRLSKTKIGLDDYSPELLKNYSVDNNVFYLTPENVGDVINDEESFTYLLDNDYLPNLTGDLYSVHNSAYNNAYESELYDKIEGELSTYFNIDKSKWVSEPSRQNSQVMNEFYYVKFNPNEVQNSIKKYVGDSNMWGRYQNNIDYIEFWLTLMEGLFENGDEAYLDFRIPDYASHSDVVKNINELFKDYVG